MSEPHLAICIHLRVDCRRLLLNNDGSGTGVRLARSLRQDGAEDHMRMSRSTVILNGGTNQARSTRIASSAPPTCRSVSGSGEGVGRQNIRTVPGSACSNGALLAGGEQPVIAAGLDGGPGHALAQAVQIAEWGARFSVRRRVGCPRLCALGGVSHGDGSPGPRRVCVPGPGLGRPILPSINTARAGVTTVRLCWFPSATDRFALCPATSL